MRKIGSEIAAGVAIFVAVVIFIVGYLYLKNVTFRADLYPLSIQFKNVTGLEPSDIVSVSGLKIGRVKNFQLTGMEVLVDIEINPDINLPKNSRAHIKSLGMVGEKFIDIIPGNSTEILKAGDLIFGTSASDFSDISRTVEGLLHQAEQFLNQVQSVFNKVFDDATQRDFKEGLLHLRKLSSALERNTAHIESSLANFDDISTNLNEMLVQRREKVETSIDNFYNASNRLEGLTNKLDTSLTSVQTLLTKIENQEGALGKVIYRDELYNDFRHLTSELDALVQDFKKRPQKYLNLKVF